jgi:hypothetical protein
MTTTYTFEQLKEDVRKEAEALRVHATKDELKQLNLRWFDPGDYNSCIYGQATGDCHSKRAAELIEKCCVRFFKNRVEGTGRFTAIKDEGFEGIMKRVNGTNVDGFIESRIHWGKPMHFSAIEAYILLPEANNANLIAFLKGETDNLEL